MSIWLIIIESQQNPWKRLLSLKYPILSNIKHNVYIKKNLKNVFITYPRTTYEQPNINVWP